MFSISVTEDGLELCISNEITFAFTQSIETRVKVLPLKLSILIKSQVIYLTKGNLSCVPNGPFFTKFYVENLGNEGRKLQYNIYCKGL